MQTHTQEEGNGGNKLIFINKKLKKYTKSRNHPQANQTKYKGAQVKFKPKRETGKPKTYQKGDLRERQSDVHHNTN